MQNVLVIGDSWSSAVVAGEGDRAGWPLLLGIPDEMRQAVSGSTAAQWAANLDGRLTKAAQTPADVVIISLLGNDAFAALADGVATPQEIIAGIAALRHVIEAVRKPRTIVMLYADPFCGSDIRKAIACSLLNVAIVTAIPGGVEILDLRTVLGPQHFDGADIHPTRAGHEASAAAVEAAVKAEGTP